mmetsp:Transcript_65687/g.156729  ORF Transcript_65687/g.156729 Transcript_65687/m.156729 type:complete len:212 (-) Transcript_65687:303-938(-)
MRLHCRDHLVSQCGELGEVNGAVLVHVRLADHVVDHVRVHVAPHHPQRLLELDGVHAPGAVEIEERKRLVEQLRNLGLVVRLSDEAGPRLGVLVLVQHLHIKGFVHIGVIAVVVPLLNLLLDLLPLCFCHLGSIHPAALLLSIPPHHPFHLVEEREFGVARWGRKRRRRQRDLLLPHLEVEAGAEDAAVGVQHVQHLLGGLEFQSEQAAQA